MHPISLSELIQYARRHSDFYRRFWDQNGFDPAKHFTGEMDLKKIPLITKEDFLSVPARSRSMLDPTDWYYFTAISSGTTAQPMVCFQSCFPTPSYYRFFTDLLEKQASSVLIIRPASYASALIGATLRETYFNPGSIISLGEPDDLASTARLAREIEADQIIARPSEAIRLAPILSKIGYPTEKIIFLWMSGEPITNTISELLKRLYPRAMVLYIYAMTEGPSMLGMRSSRCETLDTLGPNTYHLNTDGYLFEIVGESLVVTTLYKIPTPLIRYKTADRAIISENIKCSCGFEQGPVVSIGARNGNHSYKISGVTFRSEEISSILETLVGLVTKDFSLHIEQQAKDNRLVTVLHLFIRPVVAPSPLIIGAVREALERKLFITRSLSLGEFIRRGAAIFTVDFDENLSGKTIHPPSEIEKLFSHHTPHVGS